IRQSHPEISLAFVVVNCSCRQRNFALFTEPQGVRQIDHEHFKQTAEVQALIEAYQNAGLLRGAAAAPQRVLCEQASCWLVPKESTESQQFFVFWPLQKTDGTGQFGFAGMLLKSSYVRGQLLPQTANQLLHGAEDAATPIISILDEHNREIYASRSG